MLKLINPIFLIRKFFKMRKEIKLFLFYKKQTKQISESSKGSMYNLKRNRLGHLYTVINLQPELRMYHEGRELEGIEKTFVGNQLAKFNELFTEYEILEMVTLGWERKQTEEYYAYIVHTRFKWKETSIWYYIWFSVVIAGLIVAYPYIRDYIISFTDK